jgi:hypothetical protein
MTKQAADNVKHTAPQATHDSERLSSSFWDEMRSTGNAFVNHDSKLINDVSHGKATVGEYVEAGAQAAVATAAVGTALYFASPFIAAAGESISSSGIAMALAPGAMVPLIAQNAGYDEATSVALAFAPTGIRALF